MKFARGFGLYRVQELYMVCGNFFFLIIFGVGHCDSIDVLRYLIS